MSLSHFPTYTQSQFRFLIQFKVNWLNATSTKMSSLRVAIVLLALSAAAYSHSIEGHAPKAYDPVWESLDSRPLPTWYDQGKVGIFIHWGVYSVPSYINEWFWWSWKSDGSEAHDQYVKKNFKPGFAYQVRKYSHEK